MKYTLALLWVAGTNAAAFPEFETLETRLSIAPNITCGDDFYKEDETRISSFFACRDVTWPPSYPVDFPKAFENKEKFNFYLPGPYYQFPLIHGGDIGWVDGPPGPNRVIVADEPCRLVGYITEKGDSWELCT